MADGITKPRRMARLDMQRMSGVDRGANRTQLDPTGEPVDGWMVLKSDGTPVTEGAMTEDAKALEERAEKAEKALADQTAFLEAEKARVAKEAATADLDPVAKALANPDLDEGLRLVLKSQQDAIAKSQAEATEAKKAAELERDTRVAAEYVAKAETLVENLPTSAAEFGPVLRSIAESLTAEQFAKVEQVLKGANAQLEAGVLMRELGSGLGAPAEGSAFAELTAKAEELRAADPKLTAEQAIDKASTLNPALVAKHAAETRG